MEIIIETKIKKRTENQKLNDLKMKEEHKVKREMKELHRLALKQVISEDEELLALIKQQSEEIKDHDALVNELSHIAHAKRRSRPKRNSCIDANLFEGILINPIDSDGH